MADVAAVFGTLLALGIAFPGMLTAWWLLFPNVVERAHLRVAHTPGRTFAFGLVALGVALLPPLMLLALPAGPAKLAGALMLVGLLAFSTLGAAGIAAAMGARLAARSGEPAGLNSFVRGAVALELAAIFPLIGWLVVIPIATVTAYGAATFALLRWAPRPAPVPDEPPAASPPFPLPQL